MSREAHPLARIVGYRIRTLREARQLTISDLAAKADIARSYLYKIETDPNPNPSLIVLAKLADALDVRLTSLIDPDDSKELIDASMARWSRRLDKTLTLLAEVADAARDWAQNVPAAGNGTSERQPLEEDE